MKKYGFHLLPIYYRTQSEPLVSYIPFKPSNSGRTCIVN